MLGAWLVYSATHRNQARVAIKLLHPEVATDAEVTTRFLREGYVANAVGHPGTVTVLDDDVTEDNAPFLVMELLFGQTLDTMLALDPNGLSVAEVLPLLDQLLDVLAAAHDKGIVHRDLKPENLFLTSDGRLKVLDFGIARLRERSGLNLNATQTGSVLGTPAFMAPEQALGRWHEVDGRTDIWAVGATVFTLLCGCFVHEAETVQEQLVLSATRAARLIRDVCPGVPEPIANVIDRALAFERDDRFASAHEMRAALRQAMDGGSGKSLPLALVRFPDSVRVVKPADQHGATLVAPLDVTSAITGRGDTAITGQPVTRSTLVSTRPARSRWRSVAWVALGLFGIGAALLFGRGATSTPSRPRDALPTPHLQVPKTAATPDLPAVAPVLDAPLPSARGPSPVVKHLPPPAPPKSLGLAPPRATSKSPLVDNNPFDRRH